MMPDAAIAATPATIFSPLILLIAYRYYLPRWRDDILQYHMPLFPPSRRRYACRSTLPLRHATLLFSPLAAMLRRRID